MDIQARGSGLRVSNGLIVEFERNNRGPNNALRATAIVQMTSYETLETRGFVFTKRQSPSTRVFVANEKTKHIVWNKWIERATQSSMDGFRLYDWLKYMCS